MTTAQQIVSNLDDNQAILMVNKINDRIYAAVDYSTIEQSAKGDDLGNALLEISDDQMNARMDADDSVAVARRFLDSIARDESLSYLVIDAWEEVQNEDSMFVGTVIAVGLVVNLTLFMISSKIKIDLGNVTIEKDKVDTEAVKAIMEPLSKVADVAAVK